ncbi:hypothetical protein BpHYR1_031287, partial [Brachionus plicatilis]
MNDQQRKITKNVLFRIRKLNMISFFLSIIIINFLCKKLNLKELILIGFDHEHSRQDRDQNVQ